MNIGEWSKEKAETLRAEIYHYAMRHPFASRTEVSSHFNVNHGTASRHVRAIKDGWRPARDRDRDNENQAG